MEQYALGPQDQHYVVRVRSLTGPRATTAEELVCSIYTLKPVLQEA
jgi:hypothetical protein